MPQSKSSTITQKISELSLNKKMTIVVFLGLLLFIVRNSIDSNIGALTLSLIFSGCFIALLYIAIFLHQRQLQVTRTNLAQALRNNKLSEYIQSLPNNEMTQIIHLLSGSVAISQQSKEDQQQEVAKLTEVSEHLGICMEIINDSMEEEFNQIEQLVTAMHQMTATVKEVSNNASSASESTAEASAVAQEGSTFVGATISSINSLSSNIGASSEAVNNVEVKVEGIGSVVDTIRSISEQTNLLALNAAIEAARAGEAGRGFAVVADEVRNLAKRTQDATIEIQSMIEQLQKSASDAVNLMAKSVKEADIGVDQVTQAGSKLAGIVEKVHHISDLNYQIASAASEQATVAGSINENLEQVKEVVEGSVTVFREVTDMADTISQHAKVLTE